MREQGKKSGRGCLFYGGIVFAILLVVLALGTYLGYRYAKGLIDEYTDTTPISFPAVTLSDAEIQRLRERINEFSTAVDQGRAVGPLAINSDEVNALIATEPDAAPFKGHVYVTIQSNNVQAQVSIPADRFGLRPLRGRYLNAAGAFGVSLRDGQLHISPDSLSAKGKPLPESFMRQIRAQNFAEELNRDPEAQSAISKLEEIRIENGRIVIVPRNSR